MSSDPLRAARAEADAGRIEAAVRLAGDVVEQETDPATRFDALMLQAAWLDGELARPGEALSACQRADEVARGARLARTGEVDLARALIHLGLGRRDAARAAARRAGRAFRARGSAFLRGHAEAALALVAMEDSDIPTVEDHLDVAGDLASAAGDARLLSCLHVLRAEVRVQQGRRDDAARHLRLAAVTSLRLADDAIVGELRVHRDAVRRRLALPASHDE